MVELKTIKLPLQPSNLLSVYSHTGIMTVRLSHGLVEDEVRVTVDIKPLNPMLGGDA
jgi:hypothetical protein